MLFGGSHKKFDCIYTDYYRLVLFYARQYINNDEAAKEIAQDTFLAVWENIASIDLSDNVKSYILTITRNKCLNYLRKEKHGMYVRDHFQKMIIEANEQALADTSADECLRFEINELLEDTLNEMPQEMRMSYCMNRYGNFTSDEIAQQMHMSQRTVENKIYKASKILKEKFKDYR